MVRGLRRVPVLVGVCALALGVLVLGAAPSSAAGAPKGEPIKLMVIHEVDSGVATPQMPDGLKAAAKAMNAAGGLQGRPVKILECDTHNDPNTAAACGRKAVSEKVVAVVSALSSQDGEFLPLLEENKIPSVGHVLGTVAAFTSPAAFSTYAGGASQFGGAGRALAEVGAKKISVARLDVAVGGAIPTFVNFGLEPLGLKVESDVPVPVGAPDMATYAAAALANGSDGVVVGVTGQDLINLIQAIRQQDPDVPIAYYTDQVEDAIQALGDEADGLLRFTPYSENIRSSGAKKYKAEMKAADYKLGVYQLQAWTAMQVVANLTKGLPEITAPALWDALNTATNVETGMAPPLAWMTPGFPAIPRAFNYCGLTVKVKNGKEVLQGKTFIDVLTGDPCPSPT